MLLRLVWRLLKGLREGLVSVRGGYGWGEGWKETFNAMLYGFLKQHNEVS